MATDLLFSSVIQEWRSGDGKGALTLCLRSATSVDANQAVVCDGLVAVVSVRVGDRRHLGSGHSGQARLFCRWITLRDKPSRGGGVLAAPRSARSPERQRHPARRPVRGRMTLPLTDKADSS